MVERATGNSSGARYYSGSVATSSSDIETNSRQNSECRVYAVFCCRCNTQTLTYNKVGDPHYDRMLYPEEIIYPADLGERLSSQVTNGNVKFISEIICSVCHAKIASPKKNGSDPKDRVYFSLKIDRCYSQLL